MSDQEHEHSDEPRTPVSPMASTDAPTSPFRPVGVRITGPVAQGKSKADRNEESDAHTHMEQQKSTAFDEMNKKVPADPRQIIEGMIVESGQISLPFEEIELDLQWTECYEDYYGTIHEYLQSYQSVFVVSPVADSVALRSQQTQKTQSRRSIKPQKQHISRQSIGSVSYCSIADSFDISGLERLYRNRGYVVSIQSDGEVLHVSVPSRLDLFLIANGVVVWWGADRTDHWIVDDDFLQDSSQICIKHVEERHWQKDIDELFPLWCTFQYDKRSGDVEGVVDEVALLRFNEKLCFDHYLIPSHEPMRSQVMMTISFSLGRAAKVDYLEHVTRESQKSVMAVPSEVTSLMDYFSARKRIAKLEGELRVTNMTITALHDTPDFLWEMPWLRGYFVMAENQNSVVARRDWFLARADALFEKLQSIQSRRHRLFMMSSDVFLIVLLILDVVAMLMRLGVKMFFERTEP